jgi:hypothetical protein
MPALPPATKIARLGVRWPWQDPVQKYMLPTPPEGDERRALGYWRVFNFSWPWRCAVGACRCGVVVDWRSVRLVYDDELRLYRA